MPFAEGVPTTKLTLNGVTYELGWTWAAKRRVRDALAGRGKDPLATGEEEYLAAALWAAMDKEPRDSISIEQLEELIHPGNEELIAHSLRSLIMAAEPEEDQAGKTKPAAGESPTAGRQPPSKTAGQLQSTI